MAVLAQAMEGVTLANQGQDYFLGGLFGKDHWQKKGEWVGNAVKGGMKNFMEAFGAFFEGAMSTIAQGSPEGDSSGDSSLEDSSSGDFPSGEKALKPRRSRYQRIKYGKRFLKHVKQ